MPTTRPLSSALAFILAKVRSTRRFRLFGPIGLRNCSVLACAATFDDLEKYVIAKVNRFLCSFQSRTCDTAFFRVLSQRNAPANKKFDVDSF